MAQNSRSAAIGLATALALFPTAAPASPTSAPTPDAALVSWLDRDAPIAVRLEAAELEQLAALARRVGGEAAAGAGLATLGGVRYLGFDPLSRRGWQSAGLDPDSPVLLQVAAIDSTATDRAFRELSRSGGQWGTHRDGSPALWRSRLVARTIDPLRARVALVSGALVERSLLVDAANEGALAALLGAGRPGGLVHELASLDVTAVAALPGFGALLFVRQRGDVTAVDVIAPFAGDAIEWRRDRVALRAALDRPARARGLPLDGARALATPGLGVWSHPLGLFHLGQAWRATQVIRVRLGGAPLPDVVRGCARLRSLERAALTDLALHLRVTPRAIEIAARYGHRGPLAGALATSDDGVLAGVRAADLQARLPLAGLSGLRRLSRPSLFAEGWDGLWRTAAWCDGGAGPLVFAFAWPELAGLWLDELGAAMPGAAPLIAGIGNIGLAIHESAAARRDLVAVLEVALDGRAPELARAALDPVFGLPRTGVMPSPHLVWGRGPLHPYLIEGEPVRIGAGFGDSAEWRLGQLRRSASSGSRLRPPPQPAAAERTATPAPAARTATPHQPAPAERTATPAAAARTATTHRPAPAERTATTHQPAAAARTATTHQPAAAARTATPAPAARTATPHQPAAAARTATPAPAARTATTDRTGQTPARPLRFLSARGRLDRLLPALAEGRALAPLLRAAAARVAGFRLGATVSRDALDLTLSLDTR